MLLEWKLVAATCMLLGTGMHACCSKAEGVDWPDWKTKSRQWKVTVQSFFWESPGTLFSCKSTYWHMAVSSFVTELSWIKNLFRDVSLEMVLRVLKDGILYIELHNICIPSTLTPLLKAGWSSASNNSITTTCDGESRDCAGERQWLWWLDDSRSWLLKLNLGQNT